MAEDRESKRAGEAWREVGQQFSALGDSLSQAFRTAWEDERTRQQLDEVQKGLESMAQQLGRAIDEASHSPEGQRVRREMEKAAQSAHVAGEQAWRDAKPHVVSALRQIDLELQKAIDRLEAMEQEDA